MPRPLSAKIICAPARLPQDEAKYQIWSYVGIPYAKLQTKFEGSSSNSFEDIADRLPEILGVTWPRPRPFSGELFVRLLGFPKAKSHTKLEFSVLSSFEDIFNRIPKILGVTYDLGHAPFLWKLLMRPLGFPKSKPLTKFEFPSSSSFRDMFDRMSKILGVTWPKPRPFGES